MLLDLYTAFILPVPAAGISVSNNIPNFSELCGLSLYLQLFQFDPGAPANISMSQGLEMQIGN